jgi:COMPASS component SWD2
VLFSGAPKESSNQSTAIHYLSVYDNKLLRKFRGHSDQITHLSMCPTDDTFLSSSLDGSIRLWDVRQAGGLARVQAPTLPANRSPGVAPIGVFDASGLVFALTSPLASGDGGAPSAGQHLNLYDARNYGAGAFAEFQVRHDDVEKHFKAAAASTEAAALVGRAPWHHLAFNQSGNRILACADEGICLVIDGFEGTIQRVWRARSKHLAVACFTADDQTVLAGQDDGSVACYDITSGSMVKTLTGHDGRVGALTSNPKMAQFASGCQQIALWSFLA